MSNLENLSVWLWHNGNKSYHATLTTNWNTDREKRWFFSFSGTQSHNSWRAYNRSQPEQLKAWFQEQKHKHEETVQIMRDCGFTPLISKQTRNSHTQGRTVAQGFLIAGIPHTPTAAPCFLLQMSDKTFKGEFDIDSLSDKQQRQGCMGVYQWREPSEDVFSIDPW